MGKKNTSEGRLKTNLHPLAVLQGLLLMLLLLTLISFIMALFVYFASWRGHPRLLNVLTHLSVVAGALWAGSRCERKAWLHGLLVGVCAFLLLTWFGGNQGLFATWLWLKRLMRMGFVAILGGILGGLARE